jgi:hypothetical protein
MSELIRPARKGARWDLPTDRPYLVARIKSGADWWELDDRLNAIPGRRPVNAPSVHRWHAIPVSRLSDLEAIAESNPGSVIVHRTPTA